MLYAEDRLRLKWTPRHSDSQIADQIEVLNEDYSSVGINFVLANTTRTVNANWFNSVSPDSSLQTTMKRQLRQGTAADLNVYSVGFKSGDAAGLLGYATFPSDYKSNPSDDGVVILFSSVPGGSSAPYNLGRVRAYSCGCCRAWFSCFSPAFRL